jgi:hypothetical protein
MEELDIEKIVDIVTSEILRKLGETAPEVLVTEGCPDGLVSGDYACVRGNGVGSCKYVILTAEAYRALTGCGELPKRPGCEERCEDEESPCRSGVVDLRGRRLLHERDLRENSVARGTVVKISKKTIVTALANDYARGQGARIVRED